MKRQTVFTCAAVFMVVMSSSLHAEVTITPGNLQLEPYPVPEPPDGPGGENLIFSFDLLVSDPDGVSALGFQSTLGVDLPGLVYDDEYNDPYDPEVQVARFVSEAVDDDPDYWLYGVADGAMYGCPEGSNQFGFGDFASDFNLHAFTADDIVARYSFIWDGTPGDYTFTLNLDQNYSFVVDEFFGSHAIAFDPGSFPGDASSFTVSIPEPATLILFALGGLMVRRRR